MRRILLVDDDSAIRAMYRWFLMSEGFHVDVASSAEQAVEYLLGKKDVDLVLLDINMPVVNGTFLKEVLDDYDRGIKVVVCSVYPIAKQKQLVPKADEYFDKSQSPKELLEKLRLLLPEARCLAASEGGEGKKTEF